MADEQPGAAEDALHLELEHVRIGVDAPVHAAGLDQPGDAHSGDGPLRHERHLSTLLRRLVGVLLHVHVDELSSGEAVSSSMPQLLSQS